MVFYLYFISVSHFLFVFASLRLFDDSPIFLVKDTCMHLRGQCGENEHSEFAVRTTHYIMNSKNQVEY